MKHYTFTEVEVETLRVVWGLSKQNFEDAITILNKPQPSVEPVAWHYRFVYEDGIGQWQITSDIGVIETLRKRANPPSIREIYAHPPSQHDALKELSEWIKNYESYLISVDEVQAKIKELMERTA